MANIFVLIVDVLSVCSFSLCVCSQTLQTSTNLDLFMACPITEKISKSKSPKTYISWTLFNPRIHWPWLETSKNTRFCRTKVQEILCESHDLLVPPLMDNFVVEHIFTQLPMDLSMLWHLHRVNKTWFKVVDKTLAWEALEIVKFNNASYRHTIVIQGFPRLFLKVRLKF